MVVLAIPLAGVNLYSAALYIVLLTGSLVATCQSSTAPSTTPALLWSLLPQNLKIGSISSRLAGIPSPALAHPTYSTSLNFSLRFWSALLVTCVLFLPPQTRIGVGLLLLPTDVLLGVFEVIEAAPMDTAPPNSTEEKDWMERSESASMPPCPKPKKNMLRAGIL